MTKNDKKILVVGTYPIVSPRHGGQKRLDAIVRHYRGRFNSVKYVSVFFEGFYSEYSKDDIALGREGEIAVHKSPMTGDIICGESIYKDNEVKRKFVKLLRGYNPDIIHIEQPFPYLGLKPLLREMHMSPKIVFGSQNIEAPMKRDILKNQGVSEEAIRHTEDKIHRLEVDLSRESDLVVACTQADMVAHKKMGANQVVIAPNGVEDLVFTPSAKMHWQDLFKKMGVVQTAVFVGSAHPPNWVGFLEMIGKGLGFMPYDTRIVAAGSICDYFDREINQNSLNIQDVTFWRRAFSAGRLSEDRLRAIIGVSDIVLLPIVEGGGSNLKTAEAIIADKKVVATSHSLRSFEWLRDFPNVWVADTPGTFKSAIVEALATERVERTEAQKKQAQAVLWENCLKDMIRKVGEL